MIAAVTGRGPRGPRGVRGVVILAVCALVATATWLMFGTETPGNDLQAQQSSQLVGGQPTVVTGSDDYVPEMLDRVRVIGVPSDQVELVKEAVRNGQVVEASRFDFETLGQLTDAEVSRSAKRLRATLADRQTELMEMQAQAEAAEGTGVKEYRLLLDTLAGVEAYKAAVDVFDKGAYFTVPASRVFDPPKLPDGYTSVAFSLTRDNGSRIMVGIPFRREHWIGLADALETAGVVRVVELEEYAAQFNALSSTERESKIRAHLAAKITLKRGVRQLNPDTLERLRTEIFPGPFVVDSDAFLISAANL